MKRSLNAQLARQRRTLRRLAKRRTPVRLARPNAEMPASDVPQYSSKQRSA